jgi:hypothetical protein
MSETDEIICECCQQPIKLCECVTENYDEFEKMFRRWRNAGVNGYYPGRFGYSDVKIESKELGGRKPLNR